MTATELKAALRSADPAVRSAARDTAPARRYAAAVIELGEEGSPGELLREHAGGKATVAYMAAGLLRLDVVAAAEEEYDETAEWEDIVVWADAIATAAFELANVYAERAAAAEERALVHGVYLRGVAVERSLSTREEWLALRAAHRPRGWALRNGRLMRELENACKRARRTFV